MLRRSGPFRAFICVLVCGLLASMVATSCMGAIDISLPDALAILTNHLFGTPLPDDGHIGVSTDNIIWRLRFPRILLGAAVGAGLALAGVVMQASVQNTLAEPYILGISSGASFGATLAIMCGAGSIALVDGVGSVSFFSFLGSIGAVFMLWADAAARTLIVNSEVPIGILTALIGAPFFVYIMVARNYRFIGN